MDQETQRRIWREKFAAKSKESKVAKYKKLEARRKERRVSDPEYLENQRAKWRASKERSREQRKEQLNEYYRNYYKSNHERSKQIINAGKRRRDPTIGLATLAKDVRAGRKSAGELIAAISTAIGKCSTLANGSKGKSVLGK